MNIAQLLGNSALSFGDRPAVSRGATTLLSYRQLTHRAARLAHTLREIHRLRPGDRVAICMGNCPAYFEVMYGSWTAGLCLVPINAKLHPKEIAFIISSAEAGVCFTDSGLAAAVTRACDEISSLRVINVDEPSYQRLFDGPSMTSVEVAPADPAWLFYTSGTTGRPKGATLTHGNLLVMTLSYYADVDQLSCQDAILHAAPLSHASGLYALPHFGKASNNVLPESGHFEPEEVAGLVNYYSSTSFFAAPTMLTRLVNNNAFASVDLSHLKTIFYGGGPMYLADLRRALETLGPRLLQLYGQGESPCTITYLSKQMHADTQHPRWLERLASVGIARSGVEVRVADAEDRTLPAGELGEVLVRGDVVMAGYWNNAQASAETLRGGWLHTGDIGAMDADGFLTLKDRSKDLIISGGANIYPREVEEVLLQHPNVLEVSVVGRPHAEWGEEVIAFVVSRPGARITCEELDRLCLDNLARFKRPRTYRMIDALPKNNYGKVLKTELRAQLRAEMKEG